MAFSDPAHPFHFHSADVAESQPTVFISVGGQGVGNELKVRKNGAWVTMAPTQEYSNGVVDVINNKIYILTSYGAPKKPPHGSRSDQPFNRKLERTRA